MRIQSHATTINAVKIEGSITGFHGVIDVMYSSASIDVYMLTISNTSAAATNDIYTAYNAYCSSAIRYNSVRAMLPSAPSAYTTAGIYAYLVSNVAIEGCALEGGRYGAYLHTSPAACASPVNQGTRPMYGLYVRGAAVCGVAPTGSTASVQSNNATILNT